MSEKARGYGEVVDRLNSEIHGREAEIKRLKTRRARFVYHMRRGTPKELDPEPVQTKLGRYSKMPGESGLYAAALAEHLGRRKMDKKTYNSLRRRHHPLDKVAREHDLRVMRGQ